MKISQNLFSGKLSEELTSMIVSGNQLIGLAENDIKQMVEDRNGHVFTCEQENEAHDDFIKEALNQLASKQEVTSSKHILLSLQTEGSDGLSMDDMNQVKDFMDKMGEDFEIKWGLTQLEDDEKIRIILLVAA